MARDELISVGPLQYRWIDHWTDIEPSSGFAHPGYARSREGLLYTGHATDPTVIVLDPSGRVVNSFDTAVTENHGLLIADDGGTEFLWIVDNGAKKGVDPAGPAQVLKCTLDGEVLGRLTKEDFNYPEEAPFAPTACAWDTSSRQLWVSDGYGSGIITVFDEDFRIVRTIDGSDGLGRFSCPHWIWIDERSADKRVYVADRANDRIQIYDSSGTFLRGLDEGLTTPSGFCSFGEYLVVAELKARVVILDGDDTIVGSIGDAPHNVAREGWPNAVVVGETQPPQGLRPGEFNSPHGITCDPDGTIYVTEWLLGGRQIKLERVR
jgi:DNA-binding beta-propeller fold protein YncE